MSANRPKVRIAVVGLIFGYSFAEIYKDHPDVEYVGLCDMNVDLLKQRGDELGIERRHASVEEVIASDQYDAIHLLTPIPTHAQLTLDALNAGKHCACAVPMATSLEELSAIVEASRRNERNYMMMETAVYTTYYLHIKQLIEQGEFGHIQFLRGVHYQDMEGWPSYWMGLPPMHYATHAVGPLLAIANTRAKKVHCLGSGFMREELQRPYGNPYPIECAIFQLDKENLAAEVSRSLFHMARSGAETFSVYGEELSFEWLDEPVMYRRREANAYARGTEYTRHSIDPEPDFRHLLPPEIRRYADNGHHGSHPHLAHEFIRSIIEKRQASINAVVSADWTAAGICAHQSAMLGGAVVEIPSFE
ncbi:Gfo/Idh/MocA family protein [Paenibacillus spongiae]|uniref:Gfo/Idh/MocA family oxidoreductase n=1 Tax=Paenibacillus spongiae TaxID=2909671 RepID=A0ABY5S2Q6_9BACL|nr:Gfo/Idh/MocA family oxidoreductase [Paenibacillus spongiae]UVI27728.1 Gfo/Idh/MocA family oxidoreductase [Paenibacillus spongiae]